MHELYIPNPCEDGSALPTDMSSGLGGELAQASMKSVYRALNWLKNRKNDIAMLSTRDHRPRGHEGRIALLCECLDLEKEAILSSLHQPLEACANSQKAMRVHAKLKRRDVKALIPNLPDLMLMNSQEILDVWPEAENRTDLPLSHGAVADMNEMQLSYLLGRETPSYGGCQIYTELDWPGNWVLVMEFNLSYYSGDPQ